MFQNYDEALQLIKGMRLKWAKELKAIKSLLRLKFSRVRIVKIEKIFNNFEGAFQESTEVPTGKIKKFRRSVRGEKMEISSVTWKNFKIYQTCCEKYGRWLLDILSSKLIARGSNMCLFYRMIKKEAIVSCWFNYLPATPSRHTKIK